MTSAHFTGKAVMALCLASPAEERRPPKVSMSGVNDPAQEEPFWVIARTYVDGFTEADTDKMLSVCTRTVKYGDIGQLPDEREEFGRGFKKLFTEGDFKGHRMDLDEARMQIYDDLVIVYDVRLWRPPELWGNVELYIRQEDGAWQIDHVNGY